MSSDKWIAILLLVLFTALHVLAAEPQGFPGGPPGARPDGSPPAGFRPQAKTEGQCEGCDKAVSDLNKLKIAAQDIQDKAKSDSDELEEEMRRILEKRKDRIISKVDNATCPEPGRENPDLDVQKLWKSFEMDSAPGPDGKKLPDRDLVRERDKEKDKDPKKIAALSSLSQKQTVLQMRMKDEIEEAVDSKKESCARKARLKEYENGGSAKPTMSAGNNMGGGMNTNQALMMMAAMSRMNSGGSMGGMNMMGGMGSMIGANYNNSIYGSNYPSIMNMQSMQSPYSYNQLMSYPYASGNMSSFGATFPNAGLSSYNSMYPYSSSYPYTMNSISPFGMQMGNAFMKAR